MESREEIYLRQTFAQILLDDLMPGVIHNFANPLSNIMGRLKMLDRRLSDLTQTLLLQDPTAGGTVPGLSKINTDLTALNDSSQHFCAIFKHLTDKFTQIMERKTKSLNVTDMVRTEAQFADFFLEYKHNVRKTFFLEEDLAQVVVNQANLTICLTLMIAVALKRMVKESQKEIVFATSQNNGRVFISLKYRGLPVFAGDIPKGNLDFPVTSENFGVANCLALALKILETDGAAHEVTHEENWSEIRIALPPRG